MSTAREFGAQSTCDDVLQGVDLKGKRALVTGASGGLGAETARALAAQGCAVTLAARDAEKTATVLDSIRQQHPGAEVDFFPLDLASPDSVKNCAQQWRAKHSQLDMLILNAGIMACPLARNEQGWEMQFATNHLGHFLLTSALMPVLLDSAPARVVALSSAGHAISTVQLDDPNYNRSDYEPWQAYGQSKTANIWFANELDRRYQAQGVRAFSVHPGVIHTELSRYLTEESLAVIMEAMKDGEPAKPVPAGAATSVYAATAAELDGRGALYLADCQVSDENSAGHCRTAQHAFDPEGEAALWQLSERMLGITFGE